MSIDCQAIKIHSVIWRNMELPHTKENRKSPEFCIDGLIFYLESRGCYWQSGNQYEEKSEFRLKALDNSESADIIIIPYVETQGKYVRVATSELIKNKITIWRNELKKVLELESDTITMLFLLSIRSLNTDENFIPSECLEEDIIQPTRIENNTIYPYFCGEESIQTLCLKGLSEDIGKLFNDVESADATLQCADKRFCVHRKILAARSEVFSAMFKHDLSEKNTGMVNIVDLNSNILEQFLRYLYSGNIELTSMDEALELYQAAEKYSVRTLKQLCVSFILDNMSEDIVYGALVLADKAGDVAFMDGIISFALKIEGFFTSTEWKEFGVKYPNLAFNVYFKYHKQMA